MKRTILFVVFGLALSGGAAADTEHGIESFRQTDYATALKELRPEAKAGDPRAIYVLGEMYAAGLGVEKDPAMAANYFRRASLAGLVDAQNAYGVALALGTGVDQNMDEALKWLMIAAFSGHKGAQDYAGRITKYMRRIDILHARKAAQDWRAAQGAQKDSDQKESDKNQSSK